MPDRGYPMDGWRRTDATRMRSSWFGFVVGEQLWESEDGGREWRRSSEVIAVYTMPTYIDPITREMAKEST